MTKYFVIFFTYITTITAQSLHLGQDEAVENTAICIQLGSNTDLIYPCLLWHYRMGIRNIQIIDDFVPSEIRDEIHVKIQRFYERVGDTCCLGISSKGEKRIMESSQWILNISDRQFLCLYKPLIDLLNEIPYASLSLSTCEYKRIDQEIPENFWPQTDEKLIYRTSITDYYSLIFQNSASSEIIKTDQAYIATFTTLDYTPSSISLLVYDPLPITKVMGDSVKYACLRGQEYWEGNYITPPIINEDIYAERELDIFIKQYGFNSSIRFGQKYIFVPVAKSGCSSILMALGSYELDRKINFVPYRDFCQFPGQIPNRYQLLLNTQCYKFTCVRNPYIRILAAFLEKIAKENCYDHLWFLEHLNLPEPANIISFELFLEKIREKKLSELNEHFKPQWCLTMYPLVSYDLIIRLESINTEFQQIIDLLSIPGTPKDYQWCENSVKAKNFLHLYTPRCVQLVQEIYKEDFQYFGYSMEL